MKRYVLKTKASFWNSGKLGLNFLTINSIYWNSELRLRRGLIGYTNFEYALLFTSEQCAQDFRPKM